ncbi:MAG: hypothetical protein AVDCRST_MAG40-1760, partial [uncultured Gemmatimonadaceae bacterium]
EGLRRRDEEDRPEARVDVRRGAAPDAAEGHPGRAGRGRGAAAHHEHLRRDGAPPPRHAARRRDAVLALRRPLRAGARRLPRRHGGGRPGRGVERGVELAAPGGPRPRAVAPHPALGDRARRHRGAPPRGLRAPHGGAPARLELRL